MNYLENNQSYSELFKELALYLESDSVMKNYHLSTDVEGVAKFMANYEYPISAWPFIISEEIASKFECFVRPLAKLFYRSIKLFFERDSQEFAKYFNEPSIILDLLSQVPVDVRDLLIRHDVIFSKNKFKLLEVNVGSTVGGWQHDWINCLFERSLKLSKNTSSWNLRYRNITEKTFKAICSTISRSKPSATGNILMYSFDDGVIDIASFRREYKKLYKKISPFKDGELLFFDDFEALEFCSDGSLKYQGKTMDAILLTVPEEVTVPKSITLRLVSCYLSGNIIFPDNPLHAILGNKMLLALLHEEKLHEKLDSTERGFIESYVPWTKRLNVIDVIWRGDSVNLGYLLKTQKDSFVIKKARSFQGRDVHIGRFMMQQEWESTINQVKDDDGWLVQEYCEPDSVIASSSKSELGLYKPVWGVFDLDNSYSGSFVRANCSKQGNGIVNSANGALEFTVFEEY